MGGQADRQRDEQMLVHLIDCVKYYVRQVRVQYITFRKYLKYNTFTETYQQNKIYYWRPNHMHDYIISLVYYLSLLTKVLTQGTSARYRTLSIDIAYIYIT